MSLLDGILYVAGFTVAGLVAVHLFERRRLPAPLLRALNMMLGAGRQVSAKGLMRGAARFVCAYPTLFASVILVMMLQLHAPAVEMLPDGVRGVYNAATVIGILGLVLGALGSLIGAAANVASLAITVIERSVLLSLGLVLVRVFGADIAESLAWVKGNPDAALAVVAGIIVVRVMFALAPDRQLVVARGAEGQLSLLGCAIALMILMASRYCGLSWWIGVPGAIVVKVAGVFLDRAIERKHVQSQIRTDPTA